MYRNILIIGGLALLGAASASAQSTNAVSGFSSGNPRSSPLYAGSVESRSDVATAAPRFVSRRRLTKAQTDLLVRWGEVGKCVASTDRDTSVRYVAARRGSREATATAQQLDPVFDSCLAGVKISDKGNKGYRRAAVADALGATLS